MKNQNLICRATLTLSILIVSATATIAAPKNEKAFNRMDADGSGGISSEEFVTAQKAWAQERGEKNGKSEEAIENQMANIDKNSPKRFAKVDEDGDGELSMDEFAEMRAKKKKK